MQLPISRSESTFHLDFFLFPLLLHLHHGIVGKLRKACVDIVCELCITHASQIRSLWQRRIIVTLSCISLACSQICSTHFCCYLKEIAKEVGCSLISRLALFFRTGLQTATLFTQPLRAVVNADYFRETVNGGTPFLAVVVAHGFSEIGFLAWQQFTMIAYRGLKQLIGFAIVARVEDARCLVVFLEIPGNVFKNILTILFRAQPHILFVNRHKDFHPCIESIHSEIYSLQHICCKSVTVCHGFYRFATLHDMAQVHNVLPITIHRTENKQHYKHCHYDIVSSHKHNSEFSI